MWAQGVLGIPLTEQTVISRTDGDLLTCVLPSGPKCLLVLLEISSANVWFSFMETSFKHSLQVQRHIPQHGFALLCYVFKHRTEGSCDLQVITKDYGSLLLV